MAPIWILISLFYFGSCMGVAGCGALAFFVRPTSSPTFIACASILRSCLLVAAGLVAVLGGVLFAWVALSKGWHELAQDGRTLAWTSVAALVPWSLCVPRLRLHPIALLGVALVAFYAYGRAFLLVAAGA